MDKTDPAKPAPVLLTNINNTPKIAALVEAAGPKWKKSLQNLQREQEVLHPESVPAHGAAPKH